MSIHLCRTSRGIGFEIVRQLLESPNNLVIAGCRTPEKATALHGLKDGAKGTLHVIQLDVADVDSVRAVPKAIAPILGESGLDHLINNAGMVRIVAVPISHSSKPSDVYLIRNAGQGGHSSHARSGRLS